MAVDPSLLRKEPRIESRKTVVDGITFDSAAEARRYGELKMLERAGQIRNLKLQPEFRLCEGFTHEGKRERPIVYRADFQYERLISKTQKNVIPGNADFFWKGFDSIPTVEDVKGHRTEVYRLKRKLFLSLYRDQYHFIETEV